MSGRAERLASARANGDRVTFYRVDEKTFAEQSRTAEAGEIVAELIAA